MNVLFAIIAGLALIAAGYLLHLLLVERKVSAGLLAEKNKIELERQKLITQNRYSKRTIDELRAELWQSTQFAKQIERFSNMRVAEMSASLRGAHALIEMFLEKFEGLESEIHLDRKEARRLFVV